MSADGAQAALDAGLRWLVGRDSPETAIAIHEVGPSAPTPPEAVDAGRSVRRLLDAQRPDGSWAGDLLETAGTLLTLRELREAAALREQDPGIGRALEWIRHQRRRPGAWSDGCDPARHADGLCHHFAGGFFSAGEPEPPRGEATLRCGAVLRGDPEVRFVASTVALRALLRWGPPRTDDRLHLEVLRRVCARWPQAPPRDLGTPALLAAVHALLTSPAPADRAATEYGLRVVAGQQRGDGSWVDTDPFQAMDLFLAAESAGAAIEQARRGLWHSARLLVAGQKKDGSWGGGEQAPRRALLACRTLRRADPDLGR